MKHYGKRLFLVWGLMSAGLLFLAWPFQGQLAPTCTESTDTFLENFDTTNYKNAPLSSVSNWPAGPITLNQLGANFDIVQPTGMGARIYVCDAGDFDGDGKIDLMGFDIKEGNNYRLILVRNNFLDADGDGVDDDGIIYYIDETEVYDDGLTCGPASITVADYNNDGLLDFFFMKNRVDEFGYTEFLAAMYINCGTATNPNFNRYTESPNLNFSSLFRSKYVYINWAANHLCSVDIDADGDKDVLIISQDKIFLLRNPGPTRFQLSRFNLAELKYDRKTGYSSGRGGSAIAAGDFNGDGYVDLATGSVMNYNYLALYLNDQKGNFVRWDLTIPLPECTGTVGLAVEDFNLDGRLDIFGGTDAWNAGNEAHIWAYFNRGVPPPPGAGINFEFRCLNNCEPILPDPHDVDMCIPVDYDGDGDKDVVLADANHSGDYYLVKNNVAAVYATHGEAASTNIAGVLDPARYAITQVEILSLRQGVYGSSEGLTVDLYFTSNGTDWEHYATYSGAEIQNYSNLPAHKFSHFGVTLMWKAVLNAPTDPMTEFENASFDTPYIEELELKFTYVERREYSRTSVTATITDELNRKVKLIIGASFYFPGWEGQLRAYDLTDMPQAPTTVSTLRTITRSDLSSPTGREIVAENVTIYWDAGRLLDSRSPDDRLIYTALKPEGVLTRLEFSTARVGDLEDILQDFNNDPEGLINYVRGTGRDWKLGDMNHSSPQIVGPPAGDESRMGGASGSYANFKEIWKDRPPSLYVGANDGMLHCFEVNTGVERWAYIPYNLLPKLKNMWPVDQATGERTNGHDVYVDGTPAIADVYIDADNNGTSEWITILVCGQGPGMGSTVGGGLNYYFALDITDPENPLPLWEFTDPTMGETWSKPEIGKIKKNGVDTWAAFMGSGYDNDPNRTVGNTFYAITLKDGALFWSFTAPDVDTGNRPANGKINIYNSIPGSPSSVDPNQDGLTEIVYVGDLDGRIWKVNVTPDWTESSPWTAQIFYEDSNNFPIITKPAAWVNAVAGSPLPRIYFGTGGDDKAPATGLYSFVCLRDIGTNELEWFIGDASELHLSATCDRGDFVAGEKVWADPQVANYMIFFSTLTGNIESVDPCLDIAGEGKLYARYVEAAGGGLTGLTALKTESGAMEYLALEIKARSAVTLGVSETVGGVRKKEVYIHEFDSTIQKLEQPVGATLKIKSWREVYRIR